MDHEIEMTFFGKKKSLLGYPGSEPLKDKVPVVRLVQPSGARSRSRCPSRERIEGSEGGAGKDRRRVSELK